MFIPPVCSLDNYICEPIVIHRGYTTRVASAELRNVDGTIERMKYRRNQTSIIVREEIGHEYSLCYKIVLEPTLAPCLLYK